MSQLAVAYVQALALPDPVARKIMLLIAERTKSRDEDDYTMGIFLPDSEVPVMAAQVGLDAAQFRQKLRELRDLVPMDVLEHPDDWELVYGSAYTAPPPPRPTRPPPLPADGHIAIQALSLPGWDDHSTWGWEEGLGHFYAQLYRNEDDPRERPRIWITPPSYVVRTVDQLAEVIGAAVGPYLPVVMPPEAVKIFMGYRHYP